MGAFCLAGGRPLDYHQWMLCARLPLSILLLIFAVETFGGEIYRWVDEEGLVTYSDRQVPGAQSVQSAPSRSASRSDDLAAGQSAGSSPGPGPGPYETFEIAAPADNAVVTSAEGRLDIGLLLIPGLDPGHQIEFVVDGSPIEGVQGRTQLSLRGLPAGTHRLQARILDEAGAAVATTDPKTVHVRPPSPGAEAQPTSE